MKKFFCIISAVLVLFLLSSCEEIISGSFDNETLKKVRSENTSLRIQIDKLQRQIKEDQEIVLTKDLIISLYDLRHAVEKYALSNRGEYPAAENIKDLIQIVKPSLPKDFSIDYSYLETVKSSAKGYIFIANINQQKIVVSNLI